MSFETEFVSNPPPIKLTRQALRYSTKKNVPYYTDVEEYTITHSFVNKVLALAKKKSSDFTRYPTL